MSQPNQFEPSILDFTDNILIHSTNMGMSFENCGKIIKLYGQSESLL